MHYIGFEALLSTKAMLIQMAPLERLRSDLFKPVRRENHSMKPNKDKAVSEASEIPAPSQEQLQRSHRLLEALVAALPAHTRKELAGLLEKLAAGGASAESLDSIHQKALEIVSGICKPPGSQEEAGRRPEEEGMERRQGERRRK